MREAIRNPSIAFHRRLGVCAAILALAWAVVSAAQAAESASAPAAPPGEVSLHGKVAGAYDNAEFLMEASGNYYAVRIGKELWSLGIRRGDEVVVAGTMKPDAPFKNEIEARTAEISNRPSPKEPPLRVKTASAARERGKLGELVALRGKIAEQRITQLVFADASGQILVDVETPEVGDRFPIGSPVVVFGVLSGPESVRYKNVTAVLIRPTADFLRPGEPASAEKIQDILKKRPVGQLVRVQGRMSQFIGQEKGLLLNDGDARLIVRPSEQYLSLDPQVGAEVEVVGVFGYETHEGKELGTLNDARIDPMAAVENRKP